MNEESPNNLIDLINELAPPQEPPAISMVPQTVGWVIVACLLALVLCALVWRYLKYRRANAYRRDALTELQSAGTDAAQIAFILRRTALAVYSRKNVAGLSGEDWIAFLEKTGGDIRFDADSASALLNSPYDINTPPSPELNALARKWVKTHRKVEGIA